MHIITLTSDWTEHDYYVASVKGSILSRCPEARIIDISHRIRPFNTAQAAFVVRNSFHRFPEGSVHIIAVSTEPGIGGQLLAARKNNHFFLCADNGLLGLLGDPEPDLVVALKALPADQQASFVSLGVFAGAACDLAAGKPLEEMGETAGQYERQVPLRAVIENNTITGSVIYIDSYSNAITNISKELFDRVGHGQAFQIFVQSKHYMINQINHHYHETPPGELLAIFNSAGLLEIAIRNGNAASLLKLNTSSSIRVEFKEK